MTAAAHSHPIDPTSTRQPLIPQLNAVGAPAPAPPTATSPRVEALRLEQVRTEFWQQKITGRELRARCRELRFAAYTRYLQRGLNPYDGSIPLDFALFNQNFTTAVTVDAVPERYLDLERNEDGELTLDSLFTWASESTPINPFLSLAQQRIPARSATFAPHSNCLTPEIGPHTQFRYAAKHLRRHVTEAARAGYSIRPLLIGPVSFLLQSRPTRPAAAQPHTTANSPAGFNPLDKLPELLTIYSQVLADLYAAGARWVQLDESALAHAHWEQDENQLLAATQDAYRQLTAATSRPALDVTITSGSEVLPRLETAGVDATSFTYAHQRKSFTTVRAA